MVLGPQGTGKLACGDDGESIANCCAVFAAVDLIRTGEDDRLARDRQCHRGLLRRIPSAPARTGAASPVRPFARRTDFLLFRAGSLTNSPDSRPRRRDGRERDRSRPRPRRRGSCTASAGAGTRPRARARYIHGRKGRYARGDWQDRRWYHATGGYASGATGGTSRGAKRSGIRQQLRSEATVGVGVVFQRRGRQRLAHEVLDGLGKALGDHILRIYMR
jgi:hypothetical protein